MKIVIIIVVTITWGCLRAADLSDMPGGKWTLSGDARLMFKTPVGNLYKIGSSPRYTYDLLSSYHLHLKNCKCRNCVQVEMTGVLQFSFTSDSEANKRIVVIEFVMRKFPAYVTGKSDGLSVGLIRSSLSRIGLDYKDINGLLLFEGRSPTFWSPHFVEINSGLFDLSSPLFRPTTEPQSIRVIFDTKTGKYSININGWQYYSGSIEFMSETGKKPVLIRSFGIIAMGNDKKSGNLYLEVSPPTVRQFDSPDELKKLNPLQFKPYQYKGYLAIDDKKPNHRDSVNEASRSSNPDLQYAVALQLLYGNEAQCDPLMALKLLEKAAEDHHILALYQLGICYYRGYGVNPDNGKALKYIKESQRHGYQNADAMEWFINWNITHRSYYNADKIIKNFPSINSMPLDEIEHDLGLLICWARNGSFFYCMSPKYISFMDNVDFIKSKNRQIQYQFFSDYAIAKGYYPAMIAKARYSRRINSDEKFQLMNAGVELGYDQALPELLYLKAQRNQLTIKEFTPLRDLIYGDDALYLLLSYAVRNPGFPGVSAFMHGDKGRALQEFDNSKLSDAIFLKCLLRLQGKETNYSVDGLKSEYINTFSSLLNVAEAGHATAQYLVGYYKYYNDYPMEYSKFQAVNHIKMLESAYKNGNLKAGILLAEIELENGKLQNALGYLNKPCESGYGPALYLKGKILQRMARPINEIIQVFIDSARLGMHQGFREAALLSQRQPETSKKLWYTFIQADLNYRKFDIYDPYYPDVYTEFNKWGRVSSIKGNADYEQQFMMQDQEFNEKIKRYLKENQLKEQKKPRKSIPIGRSKYGTSFIN